MLFTAENVFRGMLMGSRNIKRMVVVVGFKQGCGTKEYIFEGVRTENDLKI